MRIFVKSLTGEVVQLDVDENYNTTLLRSWLVAKELTSGDDAHTIQKLVRFLMAKSDLKSKLVDAEDTLIDMIVPVLRRVKFLREDEELEQDSTLREGDIIFLFVDNEADDDEEESKEERDMAFLVVQEIARNELANIQRAEEKRWEERGRRWEEQRLVEERRVKEEQRLAEERRVKEEQRLAEEEKRWKEEFKRKRLEREPKRIEHERRLRTERESRLYERERDRLEHERRMMEKEREEGLEHERRMRTDYGYRFGYDRPREDILSAERYRQMSKECDRIKDMDERRLCNSRVFDTETSEGRKLKLKRMVQDAYVRATSWLPSYELDINKFIQSATELPSVYSYGSDDTDSTTF